jgi:hypothetical protein
MIVGVKGPKDTYNNAEVSPRIRRFVYEHAQIFRQFMHDCWHAGLTISGAKSAIAMPGIEIVGFLCDKDGRRPIKKGIQKILDWPTPMSIKEARGFVGVMIYYRIFIAGFATTAAPIFALFRKGKRFTWTYDCQLAMDTLKRCLTEAPVLVSLDLSPSGLRIVLHVDASSSVGWGVVLSQLQDNDELHPARFESGVWSDAEKKYDALKLECRGLLKVLKKFRFWLFGWYFSVKIDSQSLVWLLNQPPNDLLNAMMTRWLSYIRLFDFDTTHIPGNKNGAADALSRRGQSNEDDEESERDTDEHFEARMYGITVAGDPKPSMACVYFHEGEYMGDDLILGQYLETLQRPDGLADAEYRQLHRKARSFFICDGYLFKRGRKRGFPPRRVVGTQDQRSEIIRELHDEIGHRGNQATYGHVSRRYQWKGMYADIEKWIKTCERCQRLCTKSV